MKRSQSQNGASLIEILVAVLVLSFGLLGMAAMQARAVKGNQSSMQRTQGVMLSYYILDAMRIDKNSAKALNYNTGSLVGDVIGGICTPDAVTGTTLAHTNMRDWITALKDNMGQADDTTTCGAVLCDADGNCRVQVQWDDTRAGGVGVQTIDTATKL
ncbi:MAG: type pilus modification protein PilV [Pseudomonadota bacterium]|jgi:type IV pilus assembly protein PilV